MKDSTDDLIRYLEALRTLHMGREIIGKRDADRLVSDLKAGGRRALLARRVITSHVAPAVMARVQGRAS